MLIDSHCHLASHRFEADEVPALIDAARDVGVDRLITLATCPGDLEANLAISNHPMVHACLGIHPCDVHQAPDEALTVILRHLSDPRVCAVGETGLDYYHPAPGGWDEERFRERQRHLLEEHFQMAARSGLNVVIHTRDRSGDASFEDALAIYARHAAKVRALFHCFVGPWENAKRVIDLGGLVSFGGVVTFKNGADVRETAIACPAGSFLVETDAPYLAPEPHRGKRNMPAYVRNTAEFLASLRNESIEEFAGHTTCAAREFFRFRSDSN